MQSLIGQQLGNYRLISQLGRGGYAEVYLGEHVYLETQAAIKVLHAKLNGAEEVQHFRDEGRVIARLIHPHIVRVFDFDIRDDIPFLVMDYAPDSTLRKRHHKGEQLPLAAILPYVRQVADALRYAHDQHLVHRDVKPENMLLGRNGEVLLSDFGNALVTHTTGYQNLQQEELIGTVAYMAPEQFEGRDCPASDQYALGIVVYEWLTGYTPFHGTVTEIAVQHATRQPPPLRNSVPGIPAAVEQVVMKALAKDPQQRFPTVRDFASALEKAVAQSHTLAMGDPVVRVVRQPSPLLVSQYTKKSLLFPLLLLAMAALICGSSAWLAIDYLPGLLSPRLAASQAAIFPGVSGSYTGTMNEKTGNITITMELSIQQNEGIIGGSFTASSLLGGSGPFTGSITPAGSIQFTVQGYQGSEPLFFAGAVQPDGSLAGTYCSLGSNRRCDTRTGMSGTWKVVKNHPENVTPTATPSPTKAAAQPHSVVHPASPNAPHNSPPPPHKKHKHHH
jgi:tRNA A-37 threonylcarbamoyl transferase component Bud32